MFVQPLKAFCPSVSHSGRFMLVRPVQSSNALCPTLVQFARFTPVSPVQPLKALLPTEAQPERSRLVTLVQPENVSLPTDVQFERLTIVVRFVLSFNALFPSVKELCGKATAERLAVFVTPLFAIATFVAWLKSNATEPEAGSVICVMPLLPALFTLTVPDVWFTTSSLPRKP